MSRTLLSWYFPSVTKIKVGMLRLRSRSAWIFTAALEYFPGAHWNRARLSEIVVESKAKTSLSKLILGIGSSPYIGRTRPIRYCPKSANNLESLLSLARESEDWLTCPLKPRW